MMVGLSRLPRRTESSLLASSAASLAGFAFRELRVKDPLFDVRLFAGNRYSSFPTSRRSSTTAPTAGVGFLLSLYSSASRGQASRRGARPGRAAGAHGAAVDLAGSSPSASSRAGSPLRAWRSRRPGCSCSPRLAPRRDLGRAPGARPARIAFAMFSSPNTNAVMSSVEKHQLGVASATLGTMRGVGQMLSLASAGSCSR